MAEAVVKLEKEALRRLEVHPLSPQEGNPVFEAATYSTDVFPTEDVLRYWISHETAFTSAGIACGRYCCVALLQRVLHPERRTGVQRVTRAPRAHRNPFAATTGSAAP